MHNGMVQAEGEKMAKSEGNIFWLHEALDRFGRDAVLMYLIGGHYRQPLAFSGDRLEEASARVERIREGARRLTGGDSPLDMRAFRDRFFDALADDFNTPEALAAVFEWIREANRRDSLVGSRDLVEMLDVLGLANLAEQAMPTPPAEVVNLASVRVKARAAKNWEEADRLRDQIAQLGWEIRDASDSPHGFELLPL
jgi:cysteinyl-tRNA synthetase